MTTGNFPARQLLWLTAIIAPVVIALTEPTLSTATRANHLVLIIDRSPSMTARAADAEIIAWIHSQIRQLSHGDTVSIIAVVDNTARMLADSVAIPATIPPPPTDAASASPAAAEGAAPWLSGLPAELPASAQPGTDLAAGIQLALAQKADGVPMAIAMLTDAQHTGESASLAAARQLATALGVPIEATSRGLSVVPNVGFLAAEAPPQIEPNRPFTIRARIANTGSIPAVVAFTVIRQGAEFLPARLHLAHHGRPLPPLLLPTDSAAAPMPAQYELPADSVTELMVELPGEAAEASADSFGVIAFGIGLRVWAGENRIMADDHIAVGTVLDVPTVLAITPTGAEGLCGRFLAAHRPNLKIRTISAAEAPIHPSDFLGVTAVILDGCPRSAFPPARFAAFDAAVALAVQQLGVALLMVGGPSAFGAGGYIDTAIESVLPVDCDPNRHIEAAVAMVVDASGSMAEGNKMADLATAARAVTRHLSERDAVGLFLFADSVRTHSLPGADANGFAPATPATVAALTGHLDALADFWHQLAGPTDVFLAVDAAVRGLRARAVAAGESARLVLCLSDGHPTAGVHQTFDSAWADLLARCAAADIVLTIISTEPVEAVPLFRDLQRELPAGRGTVVAVTDLSDLARIFAETLAQTRGPLVAPAVAAGYAVRGADGVPMADVPSLARYARTRLKANHSPRSTIEAPLFLADDEPLLAMWAVGVGRAAALTVPFEMLAMAEPDFLGGGWRRLLADGPKTPGELAVIDALVSAADWLTAVPGAAPWSVAIEPASSEGAGARMVVRVDATALPSVEQRRAWLESGGFFLTTVGRPEPWVLAAVGPDRFECVVEPGMVSAGLVIGRLAAPDGSVSAPVVAAVPLHREWRELSVDAAVLGWLTTAPPSVGAVGWLRSQSADSVVGVALGPWLALLAVLMLLAFEVSRAVARSRAVPLHSFTPPSSR